MRWTFSLPDNVYMFSTRQIVHMHRSLLLSQTRQSPLLQLDIKSLIINSCPGVNSDSATVAWHCGSHLTFLVCFFIFKRDCLRWFDRVPGSSGARKLAFFPFLSEGREIARWTLQIVPPSLISLLFSQVFIIIMLLWYKILLLHYPILSKSAFLQRASCSTIY